VSVLITSEPEIHRMSQPIRTSSAAKIIGTAMMLLAFGGCSGEDIQLEGKIFDAVGIGSNSNKNQGEPVMAARSPIVLPPSLDRLPQPGAQPGAEALEVAAINDPDKKLEVNRAELEKQQAEYCKIHYEQAIAHGDKTADLATGPLGECRSSVLNAMDVKVGSQ